MSLAGNLALLYAFIYFLSVCSAENSPTKDILDEKYIA